MSGAAAAKQETTMRSAWIRETDESRVLWALSLSLSLSLSFVVRRNQREERRSFLLPPADGNRPSTFTGTGISFHRVVCACLPACSRSVPRQRHDYGLLKTKVPNFHATTWEEILSSGWMVTGTDTFSKIFRGKFKSKSRTFCFKIFSYVERNPFVRME